MQNTRLAARGRLDGCSWETLTRVLAEAERTVERMRVEDPQRYYAALTRFAQSAADTFADEALVVEANIADLQPLQDCLKSLQRCLEFAASDMAAGLRISTASGNRVVDHSIARRRQRMRSVATGGR